MVNYNGNGGHEGDSLLVGGAGHSYSLEEIEKRQQRRLCFALVTAASLFVVVGIVAISVGQARRLSYEAAQKAAQGKLALQRLNGRDGGSGVGVNAKVPRGCEATLMIMRHCEKVGPYVQDSDGNEHCSYIGLERAQFIKTLFGSSESSSSNRTSSNRTTTATQLPPPRWPWPSHLLALQPERDGHWNFREWETLEPLSRHLGINLAVVDRFDLADMYFGWLQSGSICGTLTVVSWKHEWIPELATSLGCGIDNGCPDLYPADSFDEVWQLKYVYNPKSIFDQEGTNDHDLLDSKTTTSKSKRSSKASKSHSTIGGTDTSDTSDNEPGQRQLMRRRLNTRHDWSLYATVVQQGFDPLAFSAAVGDYPDKGTNHAGRWQNEEI